MIRKIADRVKRMIASENDDTRQLSKLGILPRYTPGTFNYFSKNLKFPDAASFVSIYKELFYNEIYRFNANNDHPFIIDCGANIGLSILYFKHLYPKAKILAFEPDKEIYKYLQENVNLCINNSEVELINKGLWDKEDVLTFKNEGADAGRISYENDRTTFNGETTIETVRLSDYINSTVSFLKVDIEGAETKVIEEAEKKLHLVDNIFIEYHSFENLPQQLDKILAILTRNDYRYHLDFPTRFRRCPFTDKETFLSFDMLVNIYATRNW